MSTYATDTFAGDGSTVEFTITFDYISRDHVEVFRVANSDGAETKLSVITTGSPTGDQYIWESDNKIKVGTAPTTAQKLKVQRDTPENQQIVDWSDGSYLIAEDLNDSDLQWLYNIQELEDKFASLETTAIKYLGAIDLTVDAAPASPEGGDFFINTGDGTVLASWTGIAGDAVVGSEQVVFNGTSSEWEIFQVPSSQTGVIEVKVTAPITRDVTDPQRPDIGISAATTSAAGSMSAADKTKLDGITAGAAVTKITAGTNVTINPTGGTGNVTINATGGEIFVEEEGTQLATAATTLNFTGAGVTASGTGATKEINVPVQPGGTTTGGSTDLVFQENTMVCTASYTLTTGRSALSAGPITINNTVVITIPNNQNWVIL